MMTIHELANFTGISIRTLHYYDKIDLLKPYNIELNGYRQYNEDSLKCLQQIMFYKEMDLPLQKIKTILAQPEFDQVAAIRDQKDLLIAKKTRIIKLINLMERILEGNHGYMNSKEIIRYLDEMYGEGSTVFVGKAMEYNDTLG